MTAAEVRVDEQTIATYIVIAKPHGEYPPHPLPGRCYWHHRVAQRQRDGTA